MKKSIAVFLFFGILNSWSQTVDQSNLDQSGAQGNSAAQSQSQAVVNNVVNYNDKPLYVDGEFSEQETDSELEFINNELKKQKKNIYLNKEKAKKYNKLTGSTEKLVDATEEYVEERRESEKLIKEYNEKISCLLEKNYTNPNCKKYSMRKNRVEDKVIVKEAAPVVAPKPVALVEAPKVIKPSSNVGYNDTVKIFLGLGAKNYVGGRNFDSFESNMVFSLAAESIVWNNLAVGLRFDYNTLDFLFIEQFRPVSSRSMGLEVYGKFYFNKNSRFRPFIGAGLGLNRVNLEFTDGYNRGSFYYDTFSSFDNDQFRDNYTTNSLQGSLKVGAELAFTEYFGAFVSINYLHGFTGFGGDNFQDPIYFQEDRDVLQSLNTNILESQAFSLTAGGVISF